MQYCVCKYCGVPGADLSRLAEQRKSAKPATVEYYEVVTTPLAYFRPTTYIDARRRAKHRCCGDIISTSSIVSLIYRISNKYIGTQFTFEVEIGTKATLINKVFKE